MQATARGDQQAMRVTTTALRYWKTEHQNLANCQDAYEFDPAKGLFVVADGAGTTLFPALWADILAHHFVHIPLLSKDPFEIEWWVRLAQDEYKVRIPNNLQDWSIRQKALNQSSDSTLATLRITETLATEAHGELLVFGDSCIIIGNTQEKSVQSFVLQHPTEFAQPPICLPSTLRFFNRSFHTCMIKPTTLRLEHSVIIASDAVSKWILSAGGGRFAGEEGIWTAFQTLCEQTEESWPDFIDICREKHEMVNDDATAVILTFCKDDVPIGEPLGITRSHEEAVIQARHAAFEQARQEQNNEMLAIYFGDGNDLRSQVSIEQKEIDNARKIADALKEVLRHFRQAQNQPNLAARMQPIWQQYGPLLEQEKCAENIRATLKNNGVNLSLARITTPQAIIPVVPPPSRPQEVPALTPSSPQKQQAEAEKQAEQARKEIELNFFKTYSTYQTLDEEQRKAQYDILLNAADTMDTARARYPQLFPFTELQKGDIQHARSYKQATEGLQKALDEGYVEVIVATYQPEFISQNLLTPEQVKRIQLAKQFLAAYENEDDKAILSTYNEMTSPIHPLPFQFTQPELERIERVRQRTAKLELFRVAMESGRLPQIASSYDPILETSKEIAHADRALLRLAQSYVAAYTANDDEALVATSEKISHSYLYPTLAFTVEENSRLKQAKQNIEKRTAFYNQQVAKLKEYSITVEDVRRVCLLRDVLCSRLINDLHWTIDRNNDEELRQKDIRQRDSYQEYIHPDNIIRNALNELIRDVSIKEEMKDFKIQEAFQQEYAAKDRLEHQFQYFQSSPPSGYEEFKKRYRLSDEKIQRTIEIFVRYDFYRSYYEKQQKGAQLNPLSRQFKKPFTFDGWLLEKQRKEITYTQAQNFEQTAQWLTEKLDWKA